MLSVDWKTARGKTLTLNERRAIKVCAEQAPNDLMVNIGIFRYASMYCIRAGAPSARIVGIDIKKPDVKPDPGLGARVIIGDSKECWRAVEDGIGFLFIDGDHRYEGVKADISVWAPKVTPGGILAFHDYAPLPYHLQLLPILEGVRRAVSEWHEESEWEELVRADSLIAFKRPE